MTMRDDTLRLNIKLAGYYSHAEGARYITPLVTGSESPELIEIHESAHEYLALSNATDGVARLFAGVIACGEKELQPEHLACIRDLQTTIHRHSVFTHELIATYDSFSILQGRGTDIVSKARRQLPEFYEGVLQAGERAFGCIGDNRIGGNMFTVIYALAIAALNLPFSTDIVRFSRIPECAQFIKKNSPDQRFRLILEHIKPLWEPNGILSDLYDVKVEDEETGGYLQGMVFERLRTELPQIEFFAHQEWPRYISEWVETLMEDSQLYGYTFLQGIQVLDSPEDNAIVRSNTRVKYPGLGPEEPLDLSLTRLKYTAGSIDEFHRAALLCHQEERCLFVHVFQPPVCSESGAACFASHSSDQTAIRPFFTSCSFSELLSVLHGLPDASVFIKIDERMGPSVADQLASTGHPVFVLIHDTSPHNVVGLITSAAAHQDVMLSRIGLQGDEYSILLVQLLPKCHYFLTPITKLGVTLVKQGCAAIENVRFANSEDEVLDSLAMNFNHLSDLVPYPVSEFRRLHVL